MPETDYAVRFEILGPLRARAEAGEVLIKGLRERVVLAMLLLHTGEAVSVDQLTEAVWEAAPPRNARNQLQGCISRLRKQLAEAGERSPIIMTVPSGYRIEATPQTSDLLLFRQLRDDARRSAATGDLEGARRQYRSAVNVWRGLALVDVESSLVRRAGAGLDEERAQVVEECFETELALGGAGELVAELTMLVSQYPYRESLYGALMQALYRSGRQADALATYREVRKLLRDELGTEPGEQLQRLHQAILHHDPDLEPSPDSKPTAVARLTPRELPADVPVFSGRVDALAELDTLLARHAKGAAAPVVISAIAGTAGVGKTALAVHWAHRVSEHFPDGQLYVNLRGYEPVGLPMEPEEAIRGFLDALQVPPQRIPVSLEAQARLYRSLLAGRRMLVVLDNARNATQVRPLLPGASGCMVLVTSRDQLSSLVARDGARLVTLDVLTRPEAYQLLERRIGAERLIVEPAAVDDIIRRCAGLPLALALVAARAASHPGFPIADLAEELRRSRSGLDALADQDPASDVRAALDVSYRTLTAEGARMFRLLGLHPGPDFSAQAAASLAGVDVEGAYVLLRELTRAHLLNERSPGRYGFHDLLRTYAAERVRLDASSDAQRCAAQRMLDFYVHSARSAAMLINPFRRPLEMSPPDPAVALVGLNDRATARDWLTIERAVLVAMIGQTESAGLDARTYQLAWTLSDFHRGIGRWHEWVNTQRAAVRAAEHLADPHALATAHGNLAQGQMYLGALDDADIHQQLSLDYYIELGDHAGQAKAHLTSSVLLSRRGRYRESLTHCRKALSLFHAENDLAGQAWAVNNLGWLHAHLGNYQSAIAHCERALAIQQQIGDRRGEASTLEGLGYAHQRLGNHDQAVARYKRAANRLQDEGERHQEAKVLVRLGDTYSAVKESHAARAAWLRALSILQAIEHPDADQVRGKLGLSARSE